MYICNQLPVFLTEPLLDHNLLAEETASVQPGLGPLLDQGELVQVDHPLVVDKQLPAQPGGVAEYQEDGQGGREEQDVVQGRIQHSDLNPLVLLIIFLKIKLMDADV